MSKIAGPVIRTFSSVAALFGVMSQTACGRPEWARVEQPLLRCPDGMTSCTKDQLVRDGDTLPAWWLHRGVDTVKGQVVPGDTGATGFYDAAAPTLSPGVNLFGILNPKPAGGITIENVNDNVNKQKQSGSAVATGGAGGSVGPINLQATGGSVGPINVRAAADAVAKPVVLAPVNVSTNVTTSPPPQPKPSW